MTDCYYCSMDTDSYVIENEYAAGYYDASPSSPGHFLVFTKRHTPDFFHMTKEEQQGVNDLLMEAKELVDKDHHPAAYNLGANCGTAAGQSVRHAHFHLIPRYEGDVENPRGGVRNIMK
ncbi:MAG: HIT family protein [Alkalibacterium sp.]|nr:HIT family protein [Alkalibacterium sp.]